MMSLCTIYESCLKAIGDKRNDDVRWYLHDRPSEISRNSFYDAAIFAIWVSGMRRRSADEFLKRAYKCGLPHRYRSFARMSNRKWYRFQRVVHGTQIPARAKLKWNAVRTIAEQLQSFRSEDAFRNAWFGGKTTSASIDETDILRIAQLGLPFIRSANAHFIARNIGGDAIKCDRWLSAFMKWYEIDIGELAASLKMNGIKPGMFDLVIWAYCERYVRQVKNFRQRFLRNNKSEPPNG